MSSWIIARSVQRSKKTIISNYHDTSLSVDMPSLYMDFLASYIHTQHNGETCNVWDPTSLIKTTLKKNPQVKFIKDISGENQLTLSNYKSTVSSMKFQDIQKVASNVFNYANDFNQTVIRVLDKASIKSVFDICIHLIKDSTGPNVVEFKRYVELIKAYQVKSKKATLTIYIMADAYAVISQFQMYCDPSWKITSLSKYPTVDANDKFLQTMAEVQIMSVSPALILDFSRSIDRFIFLMQRNQRGLQYFNEINSLPWFLI